MTARILIVDDVQANVKLLEARLRSEYFEVLTALNGREALDVVSSERVDLILLDVMMPDMTGFDVCTVLKSKPETALIPVIMVTALDETEDRVKGLQCGADDFLTKPVSEIALITRVKSLIRLKMMTDELQLRAAAMESVGLDTAEFLTGLPAGARRILVIDDQPASITKARAALEDTHELVVETDPSRALDHVSSSQHDLIILSITFQNADGLRVCSEIRTLEQARHTPVLVITSPGETVRLLRAIELGINDYVIRPVDRNELQARVNTQLRRKVYGDRLREVVSNAVELAITDPLTGLYNRRYLESHLQAVVDGSRASKKPVVLMLFDIDFFKHINDEYGHDAGDDVLREFSARLKKGVRGIDLVARYGGEEFLVVMPETEAATAHSIAERLRADVEKDIFATKSGAQVPVTVSIGLAEITQESATADRLIKRADQALYAAKRGGRNRVVLDAA